PVHRRVERDRSSLPLDHGLLREDPRQSRRRHRCRCPRPRRRRLTHQELPRTCTYGPQASGPPPTNVAHCPNDPRTTIGNVTAVPLVRRSTNVVDVAPLGGVTPVGSCTPPVVSAVAFAGSVQSIR